MWWFGYHFSGDLSGSEGQELYTVAGFLVAAVFPREFSWRYANGYALVFLGPLSFIPVNPFALDYD